MIQTLLNRCSFGCNIFSLTYAPVISCYGISLMDCLFYHADKRRSLFEIRYEEGYWFVDILFVRVIG